MPGLDGPELCRRLRADSTRAHIYLLLLTARSSPTDIVAGLVSGSYVYLVKPDQRSALPARIALIVRVVTLQDRLANKVTDLQATLVTDRQFRILLTICSYCKLSRTDQTYWERVEV